jgi:NitT/TauT family transport system substrate-binding protein
MRFLKVMSLLVLSVALFPRSVTAQKALEPQTLFLGYIPNIQFAPVYVAKENGYFVEEGIDLKIEHGFNETDGLARIGVDQLQFGLISGEQVILARGQTAPVVYVATWYQKFPVGIVTAADSGIKTIADLKGRVVSIPGKFGASYTGLQAALSAAGLAETDLKELQPIGFETAPFLCNKKVEASVVYVANEPLQIEAKCFKVTVIRISDTANIVANGLVTNEKTIKNRPELVEGFTRAFLRGLRATIDNPEEAYKLTKLYVETLGDDPVQMGVLKASIALWKTEPLTDLGRLNPADWKLTMDTLIKMKVLEKPIELDKAYTNKFLPTR